MATRSMSGAGALLGGQAPKCVETGNKLASARPPPLQRWRGPQPRRPGRKNNYPKRAGSVGLDRAPRPRRSAGAGDEVGLLEMSPQSALASPWDASKETTQELKTTGQKKALRRMQLVCAP